MAQGKLNEMAVNLIEVEHVFKSIGEREQEQEIIRDCSFAIPKGSLTVMIGPSGCGKSTMIRLLAGFSRVSSGVIKVNGIPVTAPGVDRLVVFQESALFPWMSAYKNVAYGPDVRGVNRAKVRTEAEALLARVGLQAFSAKYPAQLSGGMQRRAELARAMINEPRIMILDEPFRGLDAMSKELMWNYYAALYQETANTHFFVTTDIDEAIYLADRIIIVTNRPMKVRKIIEVDLPRPRSMSMLLEDERANGIKLQALTILHEEAMRSFAVGSKAAADFVQAYARRFVK